MNKDEKHKKLIKDFISTIRSRNKNVNKEHSKLIQDLIAKIGNKNPDLTSILHGVCGALLNGGNSLARLYFIIDLYCKREISELVLNSVVDGVISLEELEEFHKRAEDLGVPTIFESVKNLYFRKGNSDSDIDIDWEKELGLK